MSGERPPTYQEYADADDTAQQLEEIHGVQVEPDVAAEVVRDINDLEQQ